MTGVREARVKLQAIYAAELKAAEAAEEAAYAAELAKAQDEAYAAHMRTLFRKL